MSISFISDIHVKSPQGPEYELLIKFLKHPKVRGSDEIFLLGDIFDLMVGNHHEYLELFAEYFDHLAELMAHGKKIHYFEGNHDLHLVELYKKFLIDSKIPTSQFILHRAPYFSQVGNYKIYFSHGDELDLQNTTYQIYKKLISSAPISWLANKIVPYAVLKKIGEAASKKSRKMGAVGFDYELMKLSYRTNFAKVASPEFDYYFCGHSHIKDFFALEKDGKKIYYVNNGYLPTTKAFTHFNDSIEFCPL